MPAVRRWAQTRVEDVRRCAFPRGQALATLELLKLEPVVLLWAMGDDLAAVGEREHTDRIFVGTRAVEAAVELPSHLEPRRDDRLRPQIGVQDLDAPARRHYDPIEAECPVDSPVYVRPVTADRLPAADVVDERVACPMQREDVRLEAHTPEADTIPPPLSRHDQKLGVISGEGTHDVFELSPLRQAAGRCTRRPHIDRELDPELSRDPHQGAGARIDLA